jgi:hypothetical protein
MDRSSENDENIADYNRVVLVSADGEKEALPFPIKK